MTPWGVVVGSWPADPDLASRCNLADLPKSAGVPLMGAVPQGSGALAPAEFRTAAPTWLGPMLHGTWSEPEFLRTWQP